MLGSYAPLLNARSKGVGTTPSRQLLSATGRKRKKKRKVRGKVKKRSERMENRFGRLLTHD